MEFECISSTLEKAYHGRTAGATIQPACNISDKPPSNNPDHVPEREWRSLRVLSCLEKPEPLLSVFSKLLQVR